ncbi:hypothetical protein QJS10_CPB13g00755 [Acorus calamus]|uniref:Protein root UVB sensitive/RUS domain-containing protein n=1 Tax=Acorus calamus TaxID=4465 RepID=A0AAV9DFV1_ACOCL|nr:hypothetical protein QJS10_CPB13g00755 [Acorus calamus]
MGKDGKAVPMAISKKGKEKVTSQWVEWFLRDFTGMLGGILFTFYQEGSQETVATMVGMALGMVLAHVTRGNPLAVWMAFLSLTVFHMYANYKAVQCLSLTTLNNKRSSILLQHFMDLRQKVQLPSPPPHDSRQATNQSATIEEAFPPFLFESPILVSELQLLPKLDIPLEIDLSSTATDNSLVKKSSHASKGGGKTQKNKNKGGSPLSKKKKNAAMKEMKNGIDRIDGLLNTMLCGLKFLKLKLEEREEIFLSGLVQKWGGPFDIQKLLTTVRQNKPQNN